MSIELDVEDYCQNCPDFKPELTTLKFLGNDFLHNVACERKRRCAGLVRYLKEQKAVKDEEL